MSTTTTNAALRDVIEEGLRRTGMSGNEVDRQLGYKGYGWTMGVRLGTRTASRGQLLKLAGILGIEPDDLLTAAGVVPPDMERALRTDRDLVRKVRELMQ